MKELLVMPLQTWKQFWGLGYYGILLPLSLCALLLSAGKKRSFKGMAGYGIFVLVCFFFPLTAGIIAKCIGSEVYWRALWLLPFPVLTACVGTWIWKLRKEQVYRWGILLVLVATLVFCGKNLYLGGAFEKTTNLQKVPQEVAQICNIITEQKEEGEQIRLAATSLVATYVRVYDPSIVMPYGRDGKGCANGVDKRLYEMLMSYEPDLKKEIKCARKNNWNYLAHWSESGEAVDVFEKAGYVCLGQVGNYFIFKDIS